MKDFLTTTKTVAPPISILWYAVMIALVLLSIWSSLKYHDNPRFVKTFKWFERRIKSLINFTYNTNLVFRLIQKLKIVYTN